MFSIKYDFGDGTQDEEHFDTHLQAITKIWHVMRGIADRNGDVRKIVMIGEEGADHPCIIELLEDGKPCL